MCWATLRHTLCIILQSNNVYTESFKQHYYSFKIFIYFIYKLLQEAWITHRASSTTRSRKKKEISNTTNMNDNTSETTKKKKKKKRKRKNRIGEDIDKKSTTHTMEQAVQWPTSVALNTHTLKGLGGVDIINRLSETQLAIEKIFLKVRY